ncbi:MAG: S-methyl-5-thioribose-1-phosphate isomerase, partial [Elusimicrobia bacterium]|nr:S-methyl-5-thioribose-1-phosphate isomerase [Elusimicrobiota bacterium]
MTFLSPRRGTNGSSPQGLVLLPRVLSRSKVQAFRWAGSSLLILEQRDLPRKTRTIRCRTHQDVADCIRRMSIRGAPAIGCAAAFGLALAAREKRFRSQSEMAAHLEKARRTLAATRPTAVNLFWALERLSRCWQAPSANASSFQETIAKDLLKEAKAVDEEDLRGCLRIGELGASLLSSNSVVLTHCNAGALATAGHGTALGIVRTAHAKGKIRKVLVDETRPYLQGARLTAWECHVEGIPYEIVTDNMAGHLMKTEKISAVIVGADRIAANGDTANKIGTYSLSVLAKHHRVPFY